MWAVFKCTLLIANTYHAKRNEQEKAANGWVFVVEQVHSQRCCLLRDIEDIRGRLFIDSKRQFIAQETSFPGQSTKNTI